MMPTPAPEDTVTTLARLGARLELSAAAGLDVEEIGPMVEEFDRLAHGIDPLALKGAQRDQVAGAVSQLARILRHLQARQAQELAAQGRDDRLRRAYGAGR